jgi:hypothetical protein
VWKNGTAPKKEDQLEKSNYPIFTASYSGLL